METLGDINRAAFTKMLFLKYKIDCKDKWIDIQAGKKVTVLGEWLIFYDTGIMVISKENNKVTQFLNELIKEIEQLGIQELLLYIN